MLKKIVLSIFILFMLACGLFAQTVQTITLKPGFNFIGFIASISSTPTQLKTQNPAIEDIYLFSAAAGSFLSATEGTLSTLAAGKGYIIKSSAASDTVISIPGDAVQTIGNINLKTGFNLIGFSKIPPTTVSFSSLMNVYSAIKGIYKWSPAAGSFIQVVRDNSGVVTLLDGADPSFKAGESYFFNLTEDTTINYDGSNIILGNGPPAPIAKTLELTGTVGASPATASPSYSLTRAIDLSSMQISVYDEINNSEVEGATITATGTDTFKATLPVATTDRYLSVLVKNTDNKVVYKSFLGRVPKATEVTENTVKISNIKVSDESTARAIIVLENRSKIPITAVIAKKSVDASISNTDFALALEERIAGLEDRVPELKQAVNLIANVLTTPGVDNAIKEKVTEFTFSESSKLLSSYISLLQNANTLQTVNNISVPTQLYVGSKQITAQSTQTDIYETVAGINDTIGQRVEMPVLDPPPGSYNSAIAVKMTCDTPNANIIYDYGDGRQGINYTGPVAINKTCKLNVAAFRSDWPMSWHSKFVNAIYTIGSGGGETAETKTLASISLDKTSEAIVFTTEKYNLSNAKITAHYSNGDSKEVQASRWEIVSGPGAFSNVDNSYFPQSKTGEAVFNAIYSENGIEKNIEFKLIAKTLEEIDKNSSIILTLSKTSDEVSINMTYDLSKIKAIIFYSDNTTKEVMVEWNKISGSGTLTNSSYTGNTIETAILTANYSENGYLKTIEFILKTIVDEPVQGIVTINNKKALITSAGGSIILDNGAILEIPPQSLEGTAEISLSEVKHPYFISPYSTTISISSTKQTKGILKIPIKNEQDINNLDVSYLDSSNRIMFLDSSEVRYSSIQRAPDRFSAGFFAVAYVSILGFIAYVNYDSEPKYLPQKTETPLIECPYYFQSGPACWAAANLMLIKAYNPNADLHTYTLHHLVQPNDDKGLNWAMDETEKEMNLLKEAIKKYTSLGEKIVTINHTPQISPRHTYKFFNRIFKSLENNKPCIGYFANHVGIFLGYINNSSYDDIELIYHDPAFDGLNLPYQKKKIKDLKEMFTGPTMPKAGTGFTEINEPPDQKRFLQTIQLVNQNGNYVDKILYNSFQGFGFFYAGTTTNFVSFDYSTFEGYKFPTDEISKFDQISIKDICCFNMSATPTDCLVKVEIFRTANNNSIIGNPIITQAKEINAVPSNTPREGLGNQSVMILYKPFTIDIPGKSFLDQINENDEYFKICTSLYNTDNLSQKLEGFDIKFKYRKLAVKPSNYLTNLPLDLPIPFVTTVGKEIISNDKINWSIDPPGSGANITAGILSVNQNATGKSFTIKGIVNDPKSIHNGKEADYNFTVQANTSTNAISVYPNNSLLCNIGSDAYFRVTTDGVVGGFDASIIEPDGGWIEKLSESEFKYIAPKKEKLFYDTDCITYHISIKSQANLLLSKTIEITVNRPYLKTEQKKFNGYDYLIYSGIFQKILLMGGAGTSYAGTEAETLHGSVKGYIDNTYSKLKFTGDYFNGQKTGRWLIYSYDAITDSGDYRIENYTNNALNGLYEKYYGYLYEKGEYQNNKRINNWFRYYANGTKKAEGTYYSYSDEGRWIHKQDGIWTEYKNDGLIDRTEEYRLGILIKTIWY